MAETAVKVERTPAEEAEFKHQQEERRRAKQQEFDPKIHGVGTVTPVEPQSVRDMFQYYLALEDRVKELEVGAEEAAASRQVNRDKDPRVPTQGSESYREMQNRVEGQRMRPTPTPPAEVEESGGTQSQQQPMPSPFSPHK